MLLGGLLMEWVYAWGMATTWFTLPTVLAMEMVWGHPLPRSPEDVLSAEIGMALPGSD